MEKLTPGDRRLLGRISEGEARREPTEFNTRVPEVSAPSFRHPVVDCMGKIIGELSDAGAATDLSRTHIA